MTIQILTAQMNVQVLTVQIIMVQISTGNLIYYVIVLFTVEELQEMELQRAPVTAVATLNDLLYVGFYGEQFLVYDIGTTSVDEPLCLEPNIIRGFKNSEVFELASCKRSRAIFAIKHVRHYAIVIRFEGTGKTNIAEFSETDQILECDSCESLSITASANILLTMKEMNQVVEYTGNGKLVRELNLHIDIRSPWHTIELSADRYVICHGESTERLHRVCIVDSSGSNLRSYGGEKGSGPGQLDVPMRLAYGQGLIFVLDHSNSRVLVLTLMLSCVKEILLMPPLTFARGRFSLIHRVALMKSTA